MEIYAWWLTVWRIVSIIGTDSNSSKISLKKLTPDQVSRPSPSCVSISSMWAIELFNAFLFDISYWFIVEKWLFSTIHTLTAMPTVKIFVSSTKIQTLRSAKCVFTIITDIYIELCELHSDLNTTNCVWWTILPFSYAENNVKKQNYLCASNAHFSHLLSLKNHWGSHLPFPEDTWKMNEWIIILGKISLFYSNPFEWLKLKLCSRPSKLVHIVAQRSIYVS